jgi:demethylmenaquinone methyltransferase/2-methoxy-6-polyprenyl-1,4-benzoquinol methylase
MPPPETSSSVTDSGAEANRFARQLFDGLPARYDTLARLLSLGQDRRWRHAVVGVVATAAPRGVLDVATGPAGIAIELERRTGAVVTGVDLTEQMLRQGVANVARLGRAGRINLLVGRAEQLPFADATFDAVTFSYLLRYVADPGATIAELARVLRPGGLLAGLEFHVPPERLWRSLWVLYTRALLPLAGWLTGGREWRDVGRFLGPSITEHYRRYPLDWHGAAWRRAGLADVQARLMSRGGGLVMWGHRAGGDG